jgi:hypothetical protein
MRHSIAACVLFFSFTPAHAQGAQVPCAMPPSDEWELLSAPPPESAQMLAITLKQGPIQTAEIPAQNDTWFHSKSGAYRYCRSTEPTDRCYAGSAFTDFQLRNGQWYVASAGSTFNCPVPQKCAQSLLTQDTSGRPNAKNVNKLERQVAFKAIAEHLSKEWSPPSTQIYMAISMRLRAEKEFLHFCIENTSTHSLQLNDSVLPWKVPNLFRFVVLNANGTTVFTSSPFIHQMIAMPVLRAIKASDSVEGDLEFSRLRFYEAAAKEDLLVMWSGPIGLYEENGPGSAELPVSGIIFVPKH